MSMAKKIEAVLAHNLRFSFELSQEAVEWLMMVWQAFQTFDDVADGDPVSREELDATIWNTLVAMHQNSFWQKNSALLAPVLGVTILKWQGSDKAEREGKANAKSYMWRAGYYDLVLMAVQICHGAFAATKVASNVMELYGEEFADYMEEFKNA